MIDVWSVAINSLWIASLATLLTLCSWGIWQARREALRFREVWARPAAQRFVSISLVLFGASLAALSVRWWERLLWAALALYWAAQLVVAWRAQSQCIESKMTPD